MLGQDGEVTKLIWNNADNTGDIKKTEISVKPISDINLHSIQQGITKLGVLTVAHNFPLSSTRRLISFSPIFQSTSLLFKMSVIRHKHESEALWYFFLIFKITDLKSELCILMRIV